MSLRKQWADGLDELKMIQPCLERTFGFKLILMDKTADETQAALDQIAGVDALAIKDGKIYTIAFRVQWGRWDTFTIRSKRVTGNASELQKYDPSSTALRPAITMQVYLSDKAVTVGYATTNALMAYAIDNEPCLPKRTANDEGNEFIVVPWSTLKEGGATWFKSKTTACPSCTRTRPS
jgi:hypothetical protein